MQQRLTVALALLLKDFIKQTTQRREIIFNITDKL